MTELDFLDASNEGCRPPPTSRQSSLPTENCPALVSPGDCRPFGYESSRHGRGAAASISQLPNAHRLRVRLNLERSSTSRASADRHLCLGRFRHGRRLAGELELRPRRKVLNVVREPVGTGQRLPANVHLATAPTHALAWVSPGLPWGESVEGDFEPPKEGSAPVRSASTQQEDDAEAYDLHKADLGPPPTAEEIIDTLSHGGRIPEVLRRRLADKGDT